MTSKKQGTVGWLRLRSRTTGKSRSPNAELASSRKPASYELCAENTAARSELSLVLSQVEEEKNKSEAMRKTNEMVKWSVEEMSLLQLQEM
ncbi:hypothetical protein Bca4012_038147 [Brassica carinata]